MDLDLAKKVLAEWLNGSGNSEKVASFLQFLSTLDKNLKSQGMTWDDVFRNLLTKTGFNSPYPWVQTPLFKAPASLLPALPMQLCLNRFPGPANHFSEPRIPRTTMPYYPPSHRTSLPMSGARRHPWQNPYYRSQHPRRRHHLDDIFLPNHDCDEYPVQEEGTHSGHSSNRSPVRIEVKTTKPETLTKDKPALVTKSNVKIVNARVSDHARSVRSMDKNSRCHDAANSGLNDGIKTIGNVRNFDASKSTIQKINGKKNENNNIGNSQYQNKEDIKTTGIEKGVMKPSVQNKQEIGNDNFAGLTPNKNCDSSILKDKISAVSKIGTIKNSTCSLGNIKTFPEVSNSLEYKTVTSIKDNLMESAQSTNKQEKGSNEKKKKVNGSKSLHKDASFNETAFPPKKKSTILNDKTQTNVEFKIDINNKDREKLQNKENKTKIEKKRQTAKDISTCTNDKNKKDDNKKDHYVSQGGHQNPVMVADSDNIRSDKKINNLVSIPDSQEKNTLTEGMGSKHTDSDLDIVKEIEDLLNTRDDCNLNRNKHCEKRKEDKNKEKQKQLSDKELTNSNEASKHYLKEANTSPTSTPSSHEAVTKDIIIKLTRCSLPESYLATNKIHKSCVKSKESSLDPKVGTNNSRVNKNSSCSYVKSIGSNNKVKKSLNTVNMRLSPTLNTPKTPRNSNIVSTIKTDHKKGDTPIIDKICILEDVPKSIDNTKTTKICLMTQMTKKITPTDVIDSAKINLKDCKVTENCSTPKRNEQTRHERASTSDIHIFEESLDDQEYSKSPSNNAVGNTIINQQVSEEFGNLNTTQTYLYSFHQKFDDPRVVDMDISYSPPPSTIDNSIEEPFMSEQQKVSDRVIKDMDALWNEISTNKCYESIVSPLKTVYKKDCLSSNKFPSADWNKKKNSIQLFNNAKMTSIRHNSNGKIEDYKKISSVTKEDKKNQEKDNSISGSEPSDGVNFTAAHVHTISERENISGSKVNKINNLQRSVSFTEQSNNLKTRPRKTYSFNDLSNINKIDSRFSARPNNIYAASISVKNIVTHDNNSKTSGTKKSSPEVSDSVLTMASNSSLMNNNPVAVGDSDISVKNNKHSYQKNRNDVKGRKKIRRIESSDEESLVQDKPVLARKESDEKPNKTEQKRKRKHIFNDNKKNKRCKNIETSEASLIKKSKANPSSAESSISSVEPQTTTKYVTKAEYLKSFSKNKSLVPNISLSIDSIPKAKTIKRRRATFTCEVDNDTILKKVDSGERCKQKFLYLFGSESEDEDDFIQTSSDKKVKGKESQCCSRRKNENGTQNQNKQKNKDEIVCSQSKEKSSNLVKIFQKVNGSSQSKEQEKKYRSTNDKISTLKNRRESTSSTDIRSRDRSNLGERSCLNNRRESTSSTESRSSKKKKKDEEKSIDKRVLEKRRKSNDGNTTPENCKKQKSTDKTELQNTDKRTADMIKIVHGDNLNLESIDSNNVSIGEKILKESGQTAGKNNLVLAQKLNVPTNKETKMSKNNTKTLPKKDAEMSLIKNVNAEKEDSNADERFLYHTKFPQKIIDKRKSSAGELKTKNKGIVTSGDHKQKIKESCRRNSAPHILNSSLDTSLVSKENGNSSLVCRALQEELIEETFQICQSDTGLVPKSYKITQMTITEEECVDKVYVCEPAEIKEESKIIYQNFDREDEDVIEIRPEIPVIDLTEEDKGKSHESSSKEPLNELLIEANIEFEDLAKGQGTITLYRSEEDNVNQDEEVQAVAASISLVLPRKNHVYKTDENLLEQDKTVSSLSKTFTSCDNNNSENTEKQNMPDGKINKFKSGPVATSQKLSSFVHNFPTDAIPQENTILHNLPHVRNSINQNVLPSQQSRIQEGSNSLMDENQRAVSSILEIFENSEHSENNEHLEISPISTDIIQSTLNQNLINSQSPIATGSLHSDTISSNVETETVDNPVQSNIINNTNQNDSEMIQNNLGNRSAESARPFAHVEQLVNQSNITQPQTLFSYDTQKVQLPRIIFRPTRGETVDASQSESTLNMRLGVAQNRINQSEESFGQHRGLPQTLREFRPPRKMKVVGTVVPPALINMTPTRINIQENNRINRQEQGIQICQNNNMGSHQTNRQNCGSENNQNTSSDNNQAGPRNCIPNQNQNRSIDNHSLVDLTEENGELSSLDMRMVVDIFSRHAYFLAHIYKAQNGYIESLRQPRYCCNYFRTEIILFQEQKQARLNSQSSRLATELQNLNIRATRNLTNSASVIVEQITDSLSNRDMPRQVTRSMVYLLIAELIKPQSELFARIPLLKALIRLCNIVIGRLNSKFPGHLTESQRRILTQQVEEYNRMFGRPSLPQIQLNASHDPAQPNNNTMQTNDQLNIESRSVNETVSGNKPVNKPNTPQVLSHGYAVSNNQLNNPHSEASTNPIARNVPTTDTNAQSSRTSFPGQFKEPQSQQIPLSHLKKPMFTSVTLPRNRGPPNVYLRPTGIMQENSSQSVSQRIGGPNPMNPPIFNIPIMQQHRFDIPRQPSPVIVSNNSRQTAYSNKHIRELPGGVNTNTLGCTPRYLSNYDLPSQSPIYASVGRPRQNPYSNNIFPPPNLNADSVRKNYQPQSSIQKQHNPQLQPNSLHQNSTCPELNILENQTSHEPVVSNINIHTANTSAQPSDTILSRLLENTPSNSKNKLAQKSPKSVSTQSPRNECSEQNVSQYFINNVVCQSPRRNALSQTRNSGESSFRIEPPNYEEAIANASKHPPGNILPNQLSPEEAKRRNESLLKELLFLPVSESVFTKPSSSTNENFRIKLPFTKPEEVPSSTMTTTSANSSAAENGTNLPAEFLINTSNSSASNTSRTPSNVEKVSIYTETDSSHGSPNITLQTQIPTSTLSTSNSEMPESCFTTTSFVAPKPSIVSLSNNTGQANKNLTALISYSATENTSRLGSSQPSTSTPSNPSNSIVLLNDSAASTSSVIDKTQTTAVLNRGLAALSSVGDTSAMLNSIVTSSNLESTHPFNASQTVSSMEDFTLSLPQNQNTSNTLDLVTANKNPSNTVTSATPDLDQSKETNNSLNNVVNAQIKKQITKPCSVYLPQVAIKQKSSKVSKSKSKSKCKSQIKKRRQYKQKKGSLSKPVDIVELLSSDEDMPLENPDNSVSENQESNEVYIPKTKKDFSKSSTAKNIKICEPNSQTIESCQSQVQVLAIRSSSPSVHKNSRKSPYETRSKKVESANAQSRDLQHSVSQIDEPQPSTSTASGCVESTGEEDIETIDLTWIDDMEDQEVQSDMDFVFIKNEDPNDDYEQSLEQNNMLAEEDMTIYTVNVQRLCICSKAAEYNCVCGEAWYCGQECQLEDWGTHQRVCQIAYEATETEEEQILNQHVEEGIHDETEKTV